MAKIAKWGQVVCNIPFASKIFAIFHVFPPQKKKGSISIHNVPPGQSGTRCGARGSFPRTIGGVEGAGFQRAQRPKNLGYILLLRRPLNFCVCGDIFEKINYFCRRSPARHPLDCSTADGARGSEWGGPCASRPAVADPRGGRRRQPALEPGTIAQKKHGWQNKLFLPAGPRGTSV